MVLTAPINPGARWLPASFPDLDIRFGLLRALAVVGMGFLYCSLWVSGHLVAQQGQFTADQIEFFEKQVRPILVEHCFECHSGRASEPKGGLRLDSREAILRGGDTGAAAVPGKPNESLLIDAINYGDLYQMPPKSKLPESKIQALTRWVALGLPWPEDSRAGTSAPASEADLRREQHWAWQPVQNVVVPPVADSLWPREPIDCFILSGLESKGLRPAREAERVVWLRRVTFDLTGLPPTEEQLQEFLADTSPDAFEKVVDRLLASPAFAERWARHWLDMVRYAESRGHEFDYDIPNAHEYRDYVIRSLQVDLPYDQWTIEHIAGDLIEQPRYHPIYGWNESVLATGFWYLGEWVHSPVDIRQDECDRLDNMLDVFSKTFLGLTVGCARCHDHKFDAISQEDYYALAGFLKSSAYRQVHFQTWRQNADVAKQVAVWEQTSQARMHEELAVLYREQVPLWKRALRAGVEVYRRALLASGSARPQASEQPVATSDSVRLVTEAAKHWGVSPDWVWIVLEELRQADSHREHPWYWLRYAVELSAREPERWALILADKLAEVQRAVVERLAGWQQTSLVWHPSILETREWPGWSCDGFAYGPGPQRAGQWIVDEGPGALRLAEYSSARFRSPWQSLTRSSESAGEPGRLAAWDRAGKIVRTQTFVLAEAPLYYLVRGSGLAYVVADSHRMINGPLHGNLLLEFRTEGTNPQWIRHDVRRYAGHVAHVEFHPLSDSPFELVLVVQGEQPPDWPVLGASDYIATSMAGDPPQDLGQLVNRFAEWWNWPLNSLASKAPVSEGVDARFWRDIAAGALAAWQNRILEHMPVFANQGTIKSSLAEKLRANYSAYEQLSSLLILAGRTAPAMWDGSGCDEWFLIRGNPKTPRAPIPRRWLGVLGGNQYQAPASGSGRLDLARHLVDPRHPLTARVYVNRLWHHLMGRGLVATVDNFGALGERPTHPELLDYLARTFIEAGWSTKHLVRRIVLSSTYRMDSVPSDPQAENGDPANRLWHRMEIKRLEGEPLRDAMLAISGRLEYRMYGPSVPIHLTPFMQGRGRPSVGGPLDGAGRRSIYIAVRRNFLSPMMLAFDTPQPFSTVGRRAVSNVPAQALILMNDPFVGQQTKQWAERLLTESQGCSSDAAFARAIQKAFIQAFGRFANDEELTLAHQFFASQAGAYGLSFAQARSDRRVWADFCHALWNTKEFIFVR